jgi:hypothetical protein
VREGSKTENSDFENDGSRSEGIRSLGMRSFKIINPKDPKDPEGPESTVTNDSVLIEIEGLGLCSMKPAEEIV